jgi:hypothetical protein
MKDTSRGITRLARTVALVAAVGLARPAAAVPGSGIRLGGSDGRLHPYVELEAHYDSNVYYDALAQNAGDLVLHVRPGFKLNVPGELAAVDLNAALDWAQYTGAESSTTGLSRLYGEAGLGIGVNRRGTLGLELQDDFRRGSGTDALSLGGAVISNRNDLRLSVPWTPGGGALVLTLGGRWQLETFEPYLNGRLCTISSFACDSTVLSKLGYSEVRGDAELKWKFLPRTAAVLEAGWFSHLANSSTYGVDVSGLRARAGLKGLLTTHLAGTLEAGYADTFGSAPEPFRTWLATAELEWLATETAGVRVGYEHDLGIDPGTLYSLYARNRVYADGRILLGSRYTARLGVQWDHRTYELVRDSTSSLVRVEPSLEAEVARWLVVSLGYAYTSRDSKLLTVTSSIPGFDYSKHEVWVRATFTY